MGRIPKILSINKIEGYRGEDPLRPWHKEEWIIGYDVVTNHPLWPGETETMYVPTLTINKEVFVLGVFTSRFKAVRALENYYGERFSGRKWQVMPYKSHSVTYDIQEFELDELNLE